MNKIELKTFLVIDNIGGRKTRESFFKKNLFDLYIEINYHNNLYFNENNFSWKRKIFHYINNITKIPTCKLEGCLNNCNYDFNMNRYYNYCSNRCVKNSFENKEIFKKTCLIKYGVDNPMKNIDIINKTKKTIKNEIIKNNNYYDGIIQKRKLTNIKIYGIDDPNKCDTVKRKKEESCIKKFGSKTNLSTIDTKNKIKKRV